MAVTLKTISERVGISQAAVSMILNRRENDLSSPETREKVFAIARELNYKQKFGHKILRGDKTHSVAIVYAMHRLLLEEQIQNLVLLVSRKLEKHHYFSSLQPIAGSAEENEKLIEELLQRGIDHFIFIGCPCGFDRIEELITRHKRNLVGFNSLFTNNISNDTGYAITTTLRQFIAEGRTNFRLFVGKYPQKVRVQAVCNVFPDSPPEEVIRKHIYFDEFSGEVNNIDEISRIGYNATRNVLEADPDISALMYVSDYHMLGGIRYLYEKNYKIGSDIKLCGFNNIHAVRNNIFPLLTWEIDMEKISSLLVEECINNSGINQLIKPKPIKTEELQQ